MRSHEKFSRDVERVGISIARSCIAPSTSHRCLPLSTLNFFFRQCQRSDWKQHKLICGKPLDYDTAVNLTTPSTTPTDFISPPENGFKPTLEVNTLDHCFSSITSRSPQIQLQLKYLSQDLHQRRETRVIIIPKPPRQTPLSTTPRYRDPVWRLSFCRFDVRLCALGY